MTNSQTVAFYTLGCKLNYSESSTLGRLFESKGYQKVSFESGADIYVINTCSVTENADKKCKKVVQEAKRHNPQSFVLIVGCYAQLKPKEISEIPGVNAVLGAAEKFRMFDFIPSFDSSATGLVYHSPVSEANSFVAGYSINDRTRTFLKVQDGCDYSCSFCTIPLARGKSRSEHLNKVLSQAKDIAAAGVKEIVLTGVNLGDYGIINGVRVHKFIDLVRALEQVDGLERIRISSIEPNLLTDEVIEHVAQSSKFVPHFHIPLQSGSNAILAKMRRRYKRELYEERIGKIKSLMPNCCIGVDVIVGFPSEREDEFLDSYNFLNELNISYLHVFTYSERANTYALNIRPAVPASQRAERSKMLHILSDKKRRVFYESQIGSVQKVLWEAEVTDGQMNGFTANYVKVSAKYDPTLVNEITEVCLTGFNQAGLVTVEDIELEVLHH